MSMKDYLRRTKWQMFKEKWGPIVVICLVFTVLMVIVGLVADHQKKNEPLAGGQAFVVRCACGSVMTVVVPPPVPPQPEYIPMPIVMPVGR